jgi:hypothetical protein
MLAWRAWEHRGHTDGIKLTEMVKKIDYYFLCALCVLCGKT